MAVKNSVFPAHPFQRAEVTGNEPDSHDILLDPDDRRITPSNEQIEAYVRFYAETKNREAEAEKAAQQVVRDAKGTKKKKPKVQKHHYTTEDESIPALARAVGDHQIKKRG